MHCILLLFLDLSYRYYRYRRSLPVVEKSSGQEVLHRIWIVLQFHRKQNVNTAAALKKGAFLHELHSSSHIDANQLLFLK